MPLDKVAPTGTPTPPARPASPAAKAEGGAAPALQSRDGFAAQPQAATPITLASERFQADATLQAVARGEKALAPGAKGAAVKRVQLALVALGAGLKINGANGTYSKELVQAMRNFQRLVGLPTSGELDQATLAALDTRVSTVDHPRPGPLERVKLDCHRFTGDPVYEAVARGEQELAPGARGEEVRKLQLTLMSLGHELKARSDGSFGGGTEAALKAFQAGAGLATTGRLDQATLLALDDAAAARVAELKDKGLNPEEKPFRYRVVADLIKCRAYVIENGSDKPVAAYLISPGTDKHPTRGTTFTLQAGLAMAWWRPPKSDWAKEDKPIEPGLDNPMGIYKLNLGQYAQFFHGIPRYAEPALGRQASHGCIRMSGTNILEFHELYAGPGTRVTLARDRKESQRLARLFADAGVTSRPIAAGQEYLAPYYYGEMGFNEQLGRQGKVIVGGRGG